MDYSRSKLLFHLISKNQRTSMRRHPLMSQNKAMKIFVYLFMAFWAVYLIFIGCAMAFALKDTKFEAFDWINGGMIIFLIIDFFTRFILQETPAQEIKPYKLLPIPQKFLINVFLIRLALRFDNLFWFFFHLPFAIFAVTKFYGLGGLIGYTLGWWLIYVLNGYWYLIWRTKIQRNIAYLLIPVVIYGALLFFGVVYEDVSSFMFNSCMKLGRGFITWEIGAYLIPIACSVVLFFINRRMQENCLYREIAQEDKLHKVKSAQMKWLNRFGIIGEYLKLEIKSVKRNSVVRTQFLSGVLITIMFCCIFAFTGIYDNQPFMKTFICVYCFSVYGTMTLTNVMGVEGNYIDFLMSRKESVLSLLKAKYYYNCIMIIMPLLITLMPVFQGKILLIETISCAFFSMGCIFPFLFQLAIYNNTTLNLNQKMTRNNGRNTKTQMIFSFAALFVPMILMHALIVALDVVTASWIMLLLGLTGVLCNGLWLRNIYNRFMLRRYVNMEGFRDSKQ